MAEDEADAPRDFLDEVFESKEGRAIIDGLVQHVRQETAAIIGQLIRLHALLELSGDPCLLCRHPLPHDPGCAVERAWNLPVDEVREAAREWARSGAADIADPAGLDWPDILPDNR